MAGPPDPFPHRVLAEIDAWRSEGTITSEQAAVLQARYRRQQTGAGTPDTSRLITTLSVLGSILVGVGVILFVASNWDRIPRAVRVSMLFFLTFSAFYVGWWLSFGAGRFPRVGRAVLLLGTLFYGASIMLVGQMYHVNANDPLLVLLWLIGVAPLAYAWNSVTIAAESVLLLALWFGLQVADWASPYDLSGEAVVTLYMALGLATFGIGLHHARWPRFAPLGKAYALLGLVSTAGGMYVPTFGDFSRNATWDPLAQGPLLVTMVVLIAVAAAGGLLAVADPGPLRRALLGRQAPYETGALLALTGVALAAFFVPGLMMEALLFNVLLALFIVGVIVMGYARRDTTIFNLGLFFFVVDVMTRYFDFFWDYLDRSVAFIGAGLLLLVGGLVLERKRRELVGRMVQDLAPEGDGR